MAHHAVIQRARQGRRRHFRGDFTCSRSSRKANRMTAGKYVSGVFAAQFWPAQFSSNYHHSLRKSWHMLLHRASSAPHQAMRSHAKVLVMLTVILVRCCGRNGNGERPTASEGMPRDLAPLNCRLNRWRRRVQNTAVAAVAHAVRASSCGRRVHSASITAASWPADVRRHHRGSGNGFRSRDWSHLPALVFAVHHKLCYCLTTLAWSIPALRVIYPCVIH